MADINSFTFTAHITQDASIRTLATGKKILSVNAAINTGYGDYKKTLFVKIQLWGDRGERIVEYLKKGQAVGVTGELGRNEWTSNEGKTYVDFVVDAKDIQLQGSRDKGGSSSSTEYPEDISF